MCLTLFATREAFSLSIHVHGSLIDLEADHAALMDILNTISRETGLSIQTDDSLTDLVSCDFKGISIERLIQRLMNNRNYVILYRKVEDGSVVPYELRILGSHSTGADREVRAPLNNEPARGNDPVPSADSHIKKVDRRRLEEELGDANRLKKQITAVAGKDGPDAGGIRITEVLKNSFLSEIGLKEGDVVQDVNGLPVDTVQRFISALQTGSRTEHSRVIRIERFNEDRKIDPIYIHLR